MATFGTNGPASAFAALQLADGNPDRAARRTALDKLTNLLSEDEIKQLRRRLNAIEFPSDHMMRLPLDLFLCILEYLEFRDFMAAFQVSSVWRERCCNPKVANMIIKKYFRTGLGNATAEQSSSDLFRQALKKRSRKRSGLFCSMSAYHYQLHGRMLSTPRKIKHQYDSGRIAYKFDHILVVQSLKQGRGTQPMVYAEANRRAPDNWLLTDELLVAHFRGQIGLVHGQFLIAWSLTCDDIQRKDLPSNIKFISARRKQVGIITSKEILLWNVGGLITEIEKPEISSEHGKRNWSTDSIIFHPVEEDHFFVFCMDPRGTDFIVQEFIERTYHKTHIPYLPERHNMFQPKFNYVRLIDQNGLCSLGWDTTKRFEDGDSRMATFDMYTLEFRIVPRPSPRLPRPLHDSAQRVWDDPLREFLLPRTLGGLDDVARLNRPDQTFELDFSLRHPGMIERCPDTVFDDDFEILFGDYGYVVWCFDENIRLPRAGSLLDTDMEPDPAARPLPLSRIPGSGTADR